MRAGEQAGRLVSARASERTGERPGESAQTEKPRPLRVGASAEGAPAFAGAPVASPPRLGRLLPGSGERRLSLSFPKKIEGFLFGDRRLLPQTISELPGHHSQAKI